MKKEIDKAGAPRRMTCVDCNGKGYLEDWDGSKKRCGMCEGTGFLEIW
jgi:DnaJ-class molecular chaperone